MTAGQAWQPCARRLVRLPHFARDSRGGGPCIPERRPARRAGDKAGEGCGIALLPDGEVVECAYVDGEQEGRWATRGPDGEIVTEFNPAVPPVGVSGDDDLGVCAVER